MRVSGYKLDQRDGYYQNVNPGQPSEGNRRNEWEGQVQVSEPEREQFRALLDLGLKDSFRLFEQADKSFSWWDYRMMGFRRNAGLRIDFILLSPALASHCTSCIIDKAPRKLERPSDHTPVVAEIS